MNENCDVRKFELAVAKQPCCATCRFFVSDDVITRIEDCGSENRVWGFEVDGECQRFPKQVTKQGSFHHDEESQWGFPHVLVKAEEFSGRDGNFFHVTSGDFSSIELPWCGEHVEKKKVFESLDFLDSDYS